MDPDFKKNIAQTFLPELRRDCFLHWKKTGGVGIFLNLK